MVVETSMMKTEIEIKLRIENRTRLITDLERVGARILHEREFEDNQLYDFPDGTLRGGGAMLRLRTLSQGALLTYKESPRVEGGAKVRDEIEVSISEGPPLAVILGRLGLIRGFRYQKYRTTYEYGPLHITLDETPIGLFAELEGPKPDIDAMAKKLGFEPRDYLAASYRDLFLSAASDAERQTDAMLFPV